MKGQDIVVLLKLVSLHQRLARLEPLNSDDKRSSALVWQGWHAAESVDLFEGGRPLADEFSVRGLEASLGISKSEVNASIKRSYLCGLAIKERKTGYPKANITGLLEFVVHGLKYVFPVEPGQMVRGIPTAAAAPVLQGELISMETYIHVWPDPQGLEMGQAIKPLYRSVPHAVRHDPELYAALALIDAIRLGKPREAKLAQQLLEKRLKA